MKVFRCKGAVNAEKALKSGVLKVYFHGLQGLVKDEFDIEFKFYPGPWIVSGGKICTDKVRKSGLDGGFVQAVDEALEEIKPKNMETVEIPLNRFPKIRRALEEIAKL